MKNEILRNNAIHTWLVHPDLKTIQSKGKLEKFHDLVRLKSNEF